MPTGKREKEQQKKEAHILAKAVELFCELGYENVSMDQMARETELTKRTLYRYFSSKEDLFYAVALQGHQKLFDLIQESVKQGGTGFDKLRQAFFAYSGYFLQYPQLAQIVNTRLYRIPKQAMQASVHFQRFQELDNALFEGLRQVFLQGKADGSIRGDVDTRMLTYTQIYTMVGFFQLLSMTGETFTQHFGLDKAEFIRFTLERQMETIRAREQQQ